MTVDFLSVLGIIVHVDHPNIAKVIGYGVEGGMHLVLELSANGSLASLLYGPKEKLDWRIRYKIALGTAQGLLFQISGLQNGYQRSGLITLYQKLKALLDEKTSIYAYGVLLLEPITVVRVLEGDESSLIEIKLRQRSRHQRTPSVADLFDADEYNPTEYLSHLNQQMVVLVNCNEKSEDHDRSTTDRNRQKGGGGSWPHRN
ncbi:hypothetical protein POTOM_032287 [Populus tomentosa]|uniref:Serine-threonine/tyrosine-protein kinase catalytic domain-containing protein n=1 Tax=Populus tomentosa TaxID=118781 RepID=A0A8X7ZK38_POPTO|nr:hypothetical protein POTOM_032287 [Populus tomentosa]